MTTSSEAILLQLKECRNLRSSHGDKFICFARVEHGGSVLGDSVRGECEGGGGVTAVELKVQVKCQISDPETLCTLARNPVLITFLEVLPKDKKAKEEKTAILGQASIDLLKFLRGSNTVTSFTAELHRCTHESGQSATATDHPPTESAKAEVDIEVSVPQSLLESPAIAQSNVLSLRLRSLHSLPDSWQPGTFPYTFTLALPLPVSETTPTSSKRITVPQGVLKLGPDKDHSTVLGHWKWPGVVGGGNSSLVPDGAIEMHALEDESGEMNSKQDVRFRQVSECEKSRVCWDVQHRAWLTSHSTRAFISQLSQCPVWPVEIARYSLPQTTGKGKVKEEEPTFSHHAVAYLNMAPLLYPGATRICGAYTLHPFNESEIGDKTKRPYNALLTQSHSTAVSTKKPTGKRAPSARLCESSATLNPDNADFSNEESEVKSEAHIYVDSKTYVLLEIVLEKPLIPKRPTSAIAERINEYIPPRPPIPRREGGVQRVVADYHKKTGEIATILLSEFRELFGEEVAKGQLSDDQDAVSERRKKLLFHLNSSGKYHAFKEQLKVAVVKLVREKYPTQAKSDNKEQLHKFLSELYVFLTDEMHAGLNKVLNLEDAAPPPPSTLNSELLKTFACEAEQCGDYELARHYYKERVVGGDHVAEYWYDYGVFCLLDSDMDRAEQCFKEAVSLDQSLVPALLLYGMVRCLDDKFLEAEEFFELSTTADPNNIIAWIMRGLYYELTENGVYQEMCFQEAAKLNMGASDKTFITPTKKKRKTSFSHSTPGPKNVATQSRVSISSKAGVNLKQQSIASVASGGGVAGGEMGVSQMLAESSNSVSSKGSTKETEIPPIKLGDDLLSPLDQKQRGPSESIVSFKEGGAQEISGQGELETPPPHTAHNLSSGSAGSIKSTHSVHHSTTAGAHPPSLAAGSTVVKSDTDSEESSPVSISIFLQTASYLLDTHSIKFAEMALAHEVASCDGELSPQYHIAEARLHLHREEYGRAEQSLRKAVALDYQNANAWSLLGHAHYLTGDFPSAKDAYERTVSYVTPPAHLHTVLLRLASIYLTDKQFDKAKETYLRACRKSPTSQTWRGVGVACYELGDLGQSEDALCEANILNNLDPVVWAYLTMVCLKTKRSAEAEQAFKFAVKTGLSDSSLVTEIEQLQKRHAPNTELVPLTVSCS